MYEEEEPSEEINGNPYIMSKTLPMGKYSFVDDR